MKRGLPLELFLGLRYLTARGSRANLSLFVWIGVGGVFLGVAALIVVLAVMTGFQDGIRDRIISANPHLLGVELARTLGVVPGDAVTVISPKGALTAVGMVPKMRRFTVVGTIEVGMYEYDASLAYLSLPAARDFAGLAGVTGVEVRLDDP